MSNYRNAAREVHRETRWTVWKFAPLAVAIVAVVVGVGFGLRSMGIIGTTIVEREVFEQSYQKQASDSRQVKLWKAQIAEIDETLRGMEADDPGRAGLEAQRSALRVQLRTVED